MNYKMHVKEIDDGTNYPIDVLSGLTGLGKKTIYRLVQEGSFSLKNEDGEEKVSGKEFLHWADSVNNTVIVEKTNYSTMEVNE